MPKKINNKLMNDEQNGWIANYLNKKKQKEDKNTLILKDQYQVINTWVVH